MARRRKGALFFNWGLVIIAFITLSAAFVVLVVKHENISGDIDKIGSRQFSLYNAYEDGEVLNEEMARTGKRAAESGAHILALHGGYTEETLTDSECDPAVSGNGTPIWIDLDQECFPDVPIGFMTYYDEAITEYFGAGAFSFGKPGYAHFIENEGSKTERMKVISRALHHLTIDLDHRDVVTLTESNFDPTTEEGFIDEIHSIQYLGNPTESYYISVSNPAELLRGMGEWSPPSWAQFTNQCNYCGPNKALFEQYYPDEFQACSADSNCCTTSCCKGTCPPGTIGLDVDYYSQVDQGVLYGDDRIRSYACGAVATQMSLQSAVGEPIDFVTLFNKPLYEGMGTAAAGTTWLSMITGYVNHHYPDVGSTSFSSHLSLQQIGEHIEQGHPLIMLLEMKYYNSERYHCSSCDTGHYVVIVGISDNEILFHDPYTRNGDGAYLVIKQSTFSRINQDSTSHYYVITPRVDLRNYLNEGRESGTEIPEPEEGGIPE